MIHYVGGEIPALFRTAANVGSAPDRIQEAASDGLITPIRTQSGADSGETPAFFHAEAQLGVTSYPKP